MLIVFVAVAVMSRQLPTQAETDRLRGHSVARTRRCRSHMLYCPRCQTALRRPHSYCRECGHDLPSDRCPNCQTATERADRFCSTCGESLSQTGPERPQDDRHDPGPPQRRAPVPGKRSPTSDERAAEERPVRDVRRQRSEGARQDSRPRRRGRGRSGRREPSAGRSRRRQPKPRSPYARKRERTPAPTREELTRRRAMRFGGGLISTGVTLSGIDGLLSLLLDGSPTEFDDQGVGDEREGSASLDPRARDGNPES